MEEGGGDVNGERYGCALGVLLLALVLRKAGVCANVEEPEEQ